MVVFAHSRHPGAARPEAARKLDASLLALALHEAEAERFLEAMDEAETRLISPASVLEAVIGIGSDRLNPS